MTKLTSLLLFLSLFLIGCSNVNETAQYEEKEREVINSESDGEEDKKVSQKDKKHEKQALIPVKTDQGEFRYTNVDGKTIIGGEFSEARPFSEGLSYYYDKSKEKGYFINESGEQQFSVDFFRIGSFHGGLATFCEDIGSDEYNLRCGYLDKQGNIAINPIYLMVTDFSQGKALGIHANQEGSWELHLISKDGNFKKLTNVPVENLGNFTSFSEGVAIVYSQSDNFSLNVYLIDLDGSVKEVNKYQDVGIYGEGLLPVLHESEANGAVWGFINGRGEEVITPKYKEVSYFSEGLSFVKRWEEDQDKWSLIDPKGKILNETLFDDVRVFFNGLAAVKIGDLWGYIDTKGDIVIKPQFTSASPFVSDLAEVYVGDRIAYINKNGTYIISPTNKDAQSNEDFNDPSWDKATRALWEYLGKNEIDKASGNILEPIKKTEDGTYEFELYGSEIIDNPETGEGHRNFFGRYGVNAEGQVYKYDF